ncbi:uncharacterized protein [Diadema setosum]|uniref:uncharacterized protein n=1 Tax=Diadema setosum TaxID=31175 RepID=UPI003B3BB183
MLKILGWRPWSSWSSCSVNCGGGFQHRRRLCDRDVPNACEGEARQKRKCNEFECGEIKDMKAILRLHEFPSGVRRAPSRWSAYRISHKAKTIRAPTSVIYGRSFPAEFSVLLTLKPKVTQRKGRGDSVVLLFTAADGTIEFGVKIAKTPSIIYRKVDGSLDVLNFTDYALDRSWHDMAFSVREREVTLVGDCDQVFTLPTDRSGRALIDPAGTASIGAGRRGVANVYFEGDIDQLVVIDDPEAADLQCSPAVRRFPDLLKIETTAQPSSSVNGMDASIDIGLVYENIYDPFQFVEEETTPSNPIGTTTPHRSFSEVTADENAIASILPSGSPGHKTTSPPPVFRQTIVWDNQLPDVDESEGEFIEDGVRSDAPVEFGADGMISIQSADDVNTATSEPSATLRVDAVTTLAKSTMRPETTRKTSIPETTTTTPKRTTKEATTKQFTTTFSTTVVTTTPMTTTIATTTPATTTDTPTTTTAPVTTTVPTTTTAPTTTSAPTTTMVPTTTTAPTTTTVPTTTTAPTTTTDPTTRATTTVATTVATTSEATTAELTTTTTQPTTTETMTTPADAVHSSSRTESNRIQGAHDTLTDDDHVLSDEPIRPIPPKNLISPGSPAEVPLPSIQEYGQPIDDGANWSTWSTCSRSCGTGTRYRYTICGPDTKLPDCKNGRGIAAQHKMCQLNNDCQGVVRWSDWGTCTRTCGTGFETRVAICRDIESHPNCTTIGQLLIERRPCQGLPECPMYCPGGCQNGGVCGQGGVCMCPLGYTGRYCETELCRHSCQNGGRCIGRNRCSCPYGFLPPFCQSPCNPSCQNGGRCVHPGRCVCPLGYTGPDCSKPICQSRCTNGGKCIAPNQCRCPVGYSGADCSQVECSPPCENGGRCIRPGFCRCPAGYRGLQCQVAYCRRSCLNGGQCSGADTCTCPRGYTGSQCQLSKCPRGCTGGSVCVGYNTCSNYVSSSSSRQTWCPLQSYTQAYTVTYVKPAIQKYRISCGSRRLQTCESSRIIYQIGYRTSQRTGYRCAPYG